MFVMERRTALTKRTKRNRRWPIAEVSTRSVTRSLNFTDKHHM